MAERTGRRTAPSARTRLAAMAPVVLALVAATTAHGQTPTPIAPSDGKIFTWEAVEYEGVEFVVEGPPGHFAVEVEVSRDASFLSYADSVWLSEESPGLYRGTGLDLLYDENADTGSWFWRSYYFGDGGSRYGMTRSFSIKPPYRRPSLRIAVGSRVRAGRRSSVVLHYRPGSQSQADRLHLIAAGDCPESPRSGLPGTVISAADPPSGGRIAAAIRRRNLGRVHLCAYVTADGVVTRRTQRTVEVVRPPATSRRMLRWRLSGRGLGPIKIGMTLGDLERITGRSAVMSYGDYPSCQQWSLRGASGLSLMRSYGRVVRLEAYRGRWRTSRGVRLGDPENKVFARYKAVRTKPHPYTTGKYLIVGPHRRRMIFETNAAQRVTSFRGGRAPHIGYIEGCV